MDVDKDNDKEKPVSLNIGELLSQARENLGLDSNDIANELHLAPEIIKKLEANEFEQEFPAAFIRGYVKSYATKVGLNVGAILAEFDQQINNEVPSLTRKETIATFNNRRKEVNSSNFLFKLISALIVLVFLVFAGWELWERFIAKDAQTNSVAETEIPLNVLGSNDLDLNAETIVSDNKEAIKEPVDSDSNLETVLESESVLESEAVLESEIFSDIDNTSNRSLLEQNSEGSQATNLVAEASKREETSQAMIELVMDFSADCWVEIVDARGEVIAIGVKRSGKHMPVQGVAPFNVILGEPSAVTMTYAGHDYDLSSYPAGRRAEIILN